MEEFEETFSYGILDGVTTNPSLVKAAVENLKSKGKNIDMKTYIKQILLTAKGYPVSLEVISTTYKEMVEEGKRLFKMFNPVAGNVVIKIPINPAFNENSDNIFDGVKAIKELSKQKIPINCTLIFTPEQALMAVKAGASYVSPFAGRIDDYIRSRNNISFEKTDYFPADGFEKNNKVLEDNGIVSGIDLVSQCRDIFDIYDIKAEIIAASMRNPRQVREAALAGAHIATIPFKVIRQIMTHYKTMEGMKKFTSDIVPEYAKVVKQK